MSNEARYFRVGLFVLTGAILIGVAVVVIYGPGGGGNVLLAETYFKESVQGLEVGSKVKFRGVTLGRVSAIGLVNDFYAAEDMWDLTEEEKDVRGQEVLVRMEITTEDEDRTGVNRSRLLAKLPKWIENGLRLELKMQGITGVVFIEADYGDPNAPYDEPAWSTGDIKFVPSVSSTIETITSAAERFMAKLEAANVDVMLKDIGRVVKDVDAKLDDLDVLALQRGVSDLIDEVGVLVEDMKATRGRVDDLIAQGRFEESAETIADTADEARLAIARINAFLESGAYDATATLENLRVAAQSLRDLADQARGYPSHMLFGEMPPASPVTNR